MADLFFEQLKAKVLLDKSFDFGKYTEAFVKRRLSIRLDKLKLPPEDYLSYIKVLDSDPEEYPRLFDAFSVNVTEFFRDPELWQALLVKYFPELMTKKLLSGNRSIKIWSAGCSTGEEPYSIAVVLSETLRVGLTPLITATDIDDDALRKAAAGRYPEAKLAGITKVRAGLVEEYFKPDPGPDGGSGAKFMSAGKELRKMIFFKKHNMLKDPVLANTDVIFCRNAMIYFSREIKETVYGYFRDSLEPGGLLVIGKSELIPAYTADRTGFEQIDRVLHIYRKK